nr:hypothetical protein [Microbacterium sp. JZ31]
MYVPPAYWYQESASVLTGLAPPQRGANDSPSFARSARASV